jgi:DNA processing protein
MSCVAALRIEKAEPYKLLGSLNDLEEKYSPKTLFFKGDTSLLTNHPRVSIIGSRTPSSKGIASAKKITKFLIKKDVVIVSGLAKGIDSVAHKTAIENGGKTIGVIGTPITQYYPKDNRDLQNTIARDHLLISQFDLNTPVRPQNFPMRNRTMALISNMSIIIEAGKTSGTQPQRWGALRLGRPLFILKDIANNKSLGWPQKLIEYGAQILSISDLDVLLDYLPNPSEGFEYDFN